MKKSLSSLSIVLLFNLTSYLSGQDQTDFNIQRRIILNGESEKQEIILPISEQNGSLALGIKSTLQEGELTIEVYDPKDEKQGNFSIGCQLNFSKPIEKSPEEMIKSLEAAGFSDEMIKSRIEKLMAIQSYELTGISNETVNGQFHRNIIKPISGNWIVRIIPKNAKGSLTIESSQTSLSQNQPSKIVTGKITDATNLPLVSVTIYVKGTTIGTISDINGNFVLSLPENAKILVFAFKGMTTHEETIGNQTRFTITLKP